MNVNEAMLSDILRDNLSAKNVVALWNTALPFQRLADMAGARGLPVAELYLNTRENLCKILQDADVVSRLWNNWFTMYVGNPDNSGDSLMWERVDLKGMSWLESFSAGSNIWREVVMTLLEFYSDDTVGDYCSIICRDGK